MSMIRGEMEGACVLIAFLSLCLCCDSAIVGEENRANCHGSDSVLKCDFIGSTQYVRVDGRVNKFQTVLVMNAGQLLLHPSVCTSISLYHIRSVMFTSTSQRAANCTGKALHLHNVTVDQIPPYLEMISVENSRLTGTFLSQPNLRKVKVVNSWLRHFDLDTVLDGEAEVRLHKATIKTLNRLQMAGRSKLFMTDSIVQEVSTDAINFMESSSAEIMRSVFQDESTVIAVHDYNEGILLANITGSWRVISKFGSISEDHKAGKQAEKQDNFSLHILSAVLSVLLVISVSYNYYTWRERKREKMKPKEVEMRSIIDT